VKKLAEALQRAVEGLQTQRDAILAEWTRALIPLGSASEAEVRERCAEELDVLLARLATGDVEGLLADEAREASRMARRGASAVAPARAIRALGRCLVPHVQNGRDDERGAVDALAALDELAMLRLETLLAAQEEASARRLIEAQEQEARAREKARESQRMNQALRRSEAESRHRAEQIGLLASVAHRIAPIREPGDLMQQAADTIRAQMNHTYVAVVMLDDGRALVGRWSGRPGVGRESRGRAEGPPGGVIGRAIRLRAPQVVGDVTEDPDYHPDVPGTRSEMVIPLLEGSEVLGALDFQSERTYAFGLDDVAAGETLAEFLVIALENARLFQLCRGGDGKV
jgi:putative methionine-R-sulfoxide reductase with GAF domain